MNTNSAVTESNLNPQERKRILRILENNWQAEMCGQRTYAALAEREADSQRSTAFRSLADAEQRRADLWAGRHVITNDDAPTAILLKRWECSSFTAAVGRAHLRTRQVRTYAHTNDRTPRTMRITQHRILVATNQFSNLA